MSSDKSMGSRLRECLGPHYSFLGLATPESALENAGAVIIPVPYDGTTTYRAGTREGPRAILAASRELEPYDEETCTEAYLHGIATLEELPVVVTSPRQMVDSVRAVGEVVLRSGKLPVLLGGEHLLSLGMIEAVAGQFADFSILHLDAHADLREEYQGSPYSNACIMRHGAALAPVVQVGVRALTAEEHQFIRGKDIPCFFAYQLHRDPSLYARIVPLLRKHVYISIDLDVFDPSVMPAVGTPEPGGLFWHEVIDLLGAVIRERQVIGFDVMELLPVPYFAAPDFLAARLVYKLLSFFFAGAARPPC
jgi:agmatinase